MIALTPIPVLLLASLSPFHMTAPPAAHHAPPPAATARAHHAPAPHKAHKARAKETPYHVWDTTVPSNVPAGKRAAFYENGAYAATVSQTAGHTPVLWIDVFGSNPNANVVDVEPGDATASQAAAWAHARVDLHPGQTAIIYVAKCHWQDVKNAVSALPKHVQDNVRYWITDPTGVDHVVPGSQATQWHWDANVDISTVLPSLTKAGA